MSRPREFDWKAAVIQYCTALLLATGMSLCVLKALLPQQALWPAVLLCAVLGLGFQGVISLRLPKKGLLLLGAVIGLMVWYALGGGPLYTAVQLVKAAFLTLRGIPEAAAPYADAARWTVCLLFSLIAAALAWDETLPLAVFTVTSVVGLTFLFGGGEGLILCALPAAAGLLLLLSGASGRRVAALPVAAALTLLAFFLLPGQFKPVPPLEKAAQSIRQFVEDYLLFNDYRTSFSLTDEGFQPLDERLGGPAEPESHSVMEVTASDTVLLRGRAYNEYSGLNWYDTLSARRYLYVTNRFGTLRDEIFDLNRPLAEAAGLAPKTLRVHMLSSGTTTLFAPQRTRTLQMNGERMVLYYNLASELFLTRNFAPGDAYTLTYLPFAPGDAATEAVIAACAGQDDPHYAEVTEQYLALPPHIQQEIRDLAYRITAGAQTPYEKALAIQNYLRNNYRYRLDVQTPPDGVDFVAWFLLGTKDGYCTYFASAMTVLCRLAGVPARYVTGYLAVPDETGVALVTGREAHAWTEVYLSGFGWLDFDATPRSDNDRGGDGQEDDPATPPPSNRPTPTPTPTNPPMQPPSPSPTPTQEPPEDGAESPSPTPSQQPGGTPTPPPGAPSPRPSPAPEEADQSPPFPWWIALILAALIALLIWRYRATEPVRRASRQPQRAVQIYFDALCALLSLRGVARKPQETLHDFSARADDTLRQTGLPPLSPLAESYAAQVYGKHPADASPFREAYLALRAGASRWGRLRLTLRRMAGR